MVAWKQSLDARLPAGSNLTLTYWVNMAGDLGYDAPGVTNDNGALLAAVQPTIDKFFFGTHTYTHPTLDGYTVAQMDAELNPNQQDANTYLGANSTHKDRWFADTMVTPVSVCV